MPYPDKGESKKDYIARFMDSPEAKADFTDPKQRVAVAYSLFEKRNTGPFGTAEHPWPKAYKCSFIEPGVVFYQDLGPCRVCGDKFTCGEGKCDTEGEVVLVGQDALAKMAQSFVGKPVIDVIHKDVQPETVAEGDADGIVTRVWLDGASGWWMAEFLVWNPETQQHCESPAYSVSCAYEPTEVDESGGEYHNIPYAENILNGQYTHLAIVTAPRYEGARIFVNSKDGGKTMSWRFWEKGARKNASPIDPAKEMVNVDGKDVPLQHLYDALEEPAKEKYNDDTVLETPKGEKTLAELKHAYRNKMKANAEMKCESCGQDKPAAKENFGKPGEKTVPEAEKAEAGHAEHREGGKDKAALPDLRASVDNPSQAEKAAKEFDKGDKSIAPLERQQSVDITEGDAEKAAKELEAKTKMNAEADAKAKADEEMRQAEEKAGKELELANAKREAGRKSFASLRNARVDGMAGDAAKISPVSIDDRLAKGAKKYGSAS